MGFQKIAILGLGLIGGSLAAAFKRKKIGAEIVGIDQTAIVEKALGKGLIDVGHEIASFRRGVRDADLVILSIPVRVILQVLPEIGAQVQDGTIITDVGSTKQEIVNKALGCLPEGVFFVGGHPMTGSEKNGLDHADPLLFENAVYVLTENDRVPSQSLSRLTGLIESIGAKIIFLTPELHDRIAATVSHLPQLLALTLMKYASEMNEENRAYLKLAAGGFRDMTRIASSPYSMWADIFQTNEKNVVEAIDSFIEQLEISKRLLLDRELEPTFEKAAHSRLAVPKDTRGFLKRHYDLSVVVEDKPGVIGAIANIMAARDLNIKDIEVLKVREGDSGTLRLALESEADRAVAHALLNESGFQASIRE